MKERSSLTVHGIKWMILGKSGKASFHYSALNVKVAFNRHTNQYDISAFGETLFSDVAAAVCLERATKVILEHHARALMSEYDNNLPLPLLKKAA